MNPPTDVTPNGHLKVVGNRSGRRWRAYWYDADGKHARILGKAWVQNTGKRTARGAVIWKAADGSKPDFSYMTPKEAEARLRRLVEHEAVRIPTVRTRHGKPVTFADAASAWLEHGEHRRNLKRSTLLDYRQALGAYLLPAEEGKQAGQTLYGRAPFATTPLRDLKPADIKAWNEGLPHGRTAEKLLMIVRAVLGHAFAHGWIDRDPSAAVERHPVGYSGDYDFYSREEVDALVRAAAGELDAAVFLTAALTGLRRGELVALRWRDVDFPGQAIRVRANYSASWSPRRATRYEACRWCRTSPRRSPGSASASASPPAGIPCSSARPAGTSTRAPCVAATPRPPSARGCGRCRSTRCATSSARWRCTEPRSCRCSRGWATPTSRRRRATCTPRARRAMQRCWPGRSSRVRRRRCRRLTERHQERPTEALHDPTCRALAVEGRDL